jgi:DNA polymerase III delta prime subunit
MLPKKPEDFHQAYFICGGRETAAALELELEKVFKTKIAGNPEVWRFNGEVGEEVFGIEESRALAEWHSRKALERHRFDIINTFSIPHEAQNSLLKLLEESSAGTHIFIIVPAKDILLPTVRSRLSELKLPAAERSSAADSSDFLKLSPPQRLKKIESIAKAKDRFAALELFDATIAELRKLPTEKQFPLIIEIEKLRSHLFDRSPSLKILLEGLSLLMP